MLLSVISPCLIMFWYFFHSDFISTNVTMFHYYCFLHLSLDIYHAKPSSASQIKLLLLFSLVFNYIFYLVFWFPAVTQAYCICPTLLSLYIQFVTSALEWSSSFILKSFIVLLKILSLLRKLLNNQTLQPSLDPYYLDLASLNSSPFSTFFFISWVICLIPTLLYMYMSFC